MEQGGFRRIQVFRLLIGQNAPAERYDLAPAVEDRENDPAREAVVGGATVFRPNQHPGLDRQVFRDRLFLKMRFQSGAAVRSKAEAEALDGLRAQTTPVQIVEPGFTAAGAQLGFEEF